MSGEQMSTERLAELYRELALDRVQDAIDKLGQTPTDRLAAHSAEALEEAAGALACITALYTHRGDALDQRFRDQIEQLVAAAASLEQLADFARHCANNHHHDL
jgi:hypothetical protein